MASKRELKARGLGDLWKAVWGKAEAMGLTYEACDKQSASEITKEGKPRPRSQMHGVLWFSEGLMVFAIRVGYMKARRKLLRLDTLAFAGPEDKKGEALGWVAFSPDMMEKGLDRWADSIGQRIARPTAQAGQGA
jgi:hypothetical protein